MSNIKDVVKEKYGQAALRVVGGNAGSCGCGCAPAPLGAVDPITVNLYDGKQTESLPRRGRARLARLRQPDRAGAAEPGEVVLDLGSGGGIDVLLSARRVGPDRQGLRPRHDRRDAGPGPREPAEGRRQQRGVPEGRDRADPAARQLASTSSSRTA